MSNLLLMVTFAKFGLLCFGGGYMIIPMLLHTFVEEEKILSMEVFGNLISLSQITPGPVSINSATYVGYLSNGITGGVFASFGLVLPGIFLAFFAVRFLQKWRGTVIIDSILTAMRMAALAMILYACLIFMQMSVFSTPVPWKEFFNFITFKPSDFGGFHLNILETVICILSFLVIRFSKISITVLLFIVAVLGGFYGYFI